MPKLYPIIFLLLLLARAEPLLAQPALVLDQLPVTFAQPVDVASSGADDHLLYIVEKQGGIQAYQLANQVTSLFLDITGSVDATSEGGLLGLAFHPDYPDSNYFYVNYTAPGTEGNFPLITTISRFTVPREGMVDAATEIKLLTIPQPATNHNGGDLAFGPDGYLYIPTGDGGGAGDRFDNAQHPLSLLGKLLRIDVDRQADGKPYAIPADNPFLSTADTLDEIWALGLRNPWRISFDRLTGDLWMGDVGQGQREEINFQPAGSAGGQNYGWNCREGLIAFSQPSGLCGSPGESYTDPVLDYPRSGNGGFSGQSVTGGFVYRGPHSDLEGYYVFGDFASSRVFLFDTNLSGTAAVSVFSDTPAGSITTFGEGKDGALYLADLRGRVYEVTAGTTTSLTSVPPVALTLYPNPATHQLTLGAGPGMPGFDRIRMYRADGRLVHEWVGIRAEAGGQVQLTLPVVAPGVYLLSATGAAHQYTGRVRIE